MFALDLELKKISAPEDSLNHASLLINEINDQSDIDTDYLINETEKWCRETNPITRNFFILLLSNFILYNPHSFLTYTIFHSCIDDDNIYDGVEQEDEKKHNPRSESVYGNLEEDPYFKIQNPYYGGDVEMDGTPNNPNNPDFTNVELVTAQTNIYYEM